MNDPSSADGYNAGYADQLYERSLRDRGIVPPSLVDASGNGVAAVPAPSTASASPGAVAEDLLRTAAAAGGLVEALRTHGHLFVPLDPLGTEPPGHPSLTPEFHGVSHADLSRVPAAAINLAHLGSTALEAVRSLEKAYCGRIGYELDHMDDVDEWNWLASYIEKGTHWKPLSREARIRVLEILTEVEGFERFLHRAFLGQKRFSIEGLDVMIPMLSSAVRIAAAGGTRKVFLGMAHRGRLSVLSRLVGRPYESIIAEFEGEYERGLQTMIPGSGDVKYHLGARQTVETSGGTVEVILSPNPSHLEHVNPVVEGMARAAREQLVQEASPTRNGNLLKFDEKHGTAVLPVLIHGDAAFIGQGVVAETLNLCRLQGYETGGTLHLVANNQLGFTTDPEDGRSTRYASDLALAFRIPILHVNADDTEACLAAVRLAMDYRTRFGQDIVIDLVGYRRYGHNEGDEPSYTQPRMYGQIEKHPTVRDQWVERLEADGTIEPGRGQEMADTFEERMREARRWVTEQTDEAPPPDPIGFELPGIDPEGASAPVPPGEVTTRVDRALLERVNDALHSWPEDFGVFPKLARQLTARRERLESELDWAHAEALALGALLEDGVPIRFTGEDVQRGTFSQRHSVLHDVESGEEYIPLTHLSEDQAWFQIWNSPLSEVACLGFEYGYSVFCPDALVIWEAQFGDFANVAQAIIDQFIVSGRSKWGIESRLVLLLPHGYEGQGPEHSSARLERFLNLCAEDNIRVANCSTPAQYFHLLRLQGLRADRRPLVVMTPKSLLRHPSAKSGASELTDDDFHPVIDGTRDERDGVRRLVLCSGKVYYDVVGSSRWEQAQGVDVARLEMLYPFPEPELRRVLDSYPALEELVWLQEEPGNMGAWRYLRGLLAGLSTDARPFQLRAVTRPESASPAAGMAHAHAREQEALIEAALTT